MKLFKNMLIGVACALTLFMSVGCNTLAPEGPYGKMGVAGKWIYTTDTAADQSLKILDAAQSWELANHSYLKTNAPKVVKMFAEMRTNAPTYYYTYATASIGFRSAYGTPSLNVYSNKVVAAFNTLTNASAKMEAITKSTKVN